CRQRAIDGTADFGRASKHDAGDTTIGDERRTNLAITRDQLQRANRDPGRMQELHCRSRDQWSLLGGVRDDTISGGQGCDNLTNEDGEWKIPRANAGKNAAPAESQLVALTGRARQSF